MSEIKNLIALTKLHISQHYEKNDKVCTNPETVAYYRAFARQDKKNPAPQLPSRPVIHPTPRPKKTVPPPAKAVKKETPAPQREDKIDRVTPAAAVEVDFSDLIKTLTTYFPAQKILDHLPDDTRAKETAQKWKHPIRPSEIWIQDSARTPSEKLFLKNVAQAIETYFYPAEVISSSAPAPEHALRLALGTEEFVNRFSAPKLVMEPISNYLETPQKKAQLWKDLRNTLQSS